MLVAGNESVKRMVYFVGRVLVFVADGHVGSDDRRLFNTGSYVQSWVVAAGGHCCAVRMACGLWA